MRFPLRCKSSATPYAARDSFPVRPTIAQVSYRSSLSIVCASPRGMASEPLVASESAELPAGFPPGLRVEAVAAVDDPSRADDLGELLGVGVPELFPLRQHEHDVGALRGLVERRGVVDLRQGVAGVVDA